MTLLKKTWPGHDEIIDRLTQSSGVTHRNLILPLERYPELKGFEERNKIYTMSILDLAENCVKKLQERTGFNWSDLGLIVSTSITGIAVPSIDARLMNRLPIPHHIARLPLFGLGCLGGVAAINRAKDLLEAYPQKLALVLAAEACTLTFQFQDLSMANMVACSLFGDGAGAVLLAGKDHPLARAGKLEILDTGSFFYPNTEEVMGWEMWDSGFKVVLSGSVPSMVEKFVGHDIETFLSLHKLSTENINNIISHPGGPKVLVALSKVLKKEESYLMHSWQSLAQQGNMSSVSVFNVLERSLNEKSLRSGYGLGLAMGPAFNTELTLYQVTP